MKRDCKSTLFLKSQLMVSTCIFFSVTHQPGPRSSATVPQLNPSIAEHKILAVLLRNLWSLNYWREYAYRRKNAASLRVGERIYPVTWNRSTLASLGRIRSTCIVKYYSVIRPLDASKGTEVDQDPDNVPNVPPLICRFRCRHVMHLETRFLTTHQTPASLMPRRPPFYPSSQGTEDPPAARPLLASLHGDHRLRSLEQTPR